MSKLDAAKNEAKEVTSVTFNYDGHDYTVAAGKKVSLDVAEAMEERMWLAATKALLGPDQWKTFKSKPRDIEDLEALLEKAKGETGVDLGE